MQIRIRDSEGCEVQPHLLWDSVWHQEIGAEGGFADWHLESPVADGGDPANQGGLRARATLHTATMILLFTDARAPEGEALPDMSEDRRGWWGDSYPLPGEPEDARLGSLLWLLERSPLDDATRITARDYVAEALDTLRLQGAVARTDVDVVTDILAGRLEILVRHYSHSGATIYDQRFDVLWRQEITPAQMNFGDSLRV